MNSFIPRKQKKLRIMTYSCAFLLIIGVAVIALRIAQQNVPAPTPSLSLELKLNYKTLSISQVNSWLGSVTLSNHTSQAIVIKINGGCWMQYLTFLIVNDKGEKVSTDYYSLVYFLNAHQTEDVIQPGTRENAVTGEGIIGDAGLVPGKYTIQAVFSYHAYQAESNTIEITLIH
jgi:hypothetical protein